MKTSKIILLTIFFTFLGLIVYYFYPEKKLTDGQKADKIVINKSKHELLLYYNAELIANYNVSLSCKGLDKKEMIGDSLTPEGRFIGKKRTSTNFHKAISVGKWGECCAVLIHGLGKKYGRFKKFQRWRDWTQGCIALTNDEIDEIYKSVNDGVIIEINP